MYWILFLFFVIIVGWLLVMLLTDGRYGGKRIMQQVYDRLGSTLFSRQSEADLWQRLAVELNLRGDEKILDVGTAVGDLPLAFAITPNFQGLITGIDWSPRMINTAKQKAAQQHVEHLIHFEVVDVLKAGLPFNNDQFDIVTCLGLLETIRQPQKLLAEFERVLAPEGQLALSLYRRRSWLGASLDISWYTTYLRPLGLTDLRVVVCRKSQDVLIATRII